MLLVAYWSYGVWPFLPIEGDDQGVIFGAQAMLRHDPVLMLQRYLYPVQPGSYHVLIALHHITGAAVETVYGCMTALGALLFALIGARVLADLAGIRFAWALVALLWCQEITTAACYFNTSTLAGAAAMAGVWFSSRPAGRFGLVAAGLALAVAGWLRADSLLLSPVCLAVAYWRLQSWPAALIRTAVVAAIAIASVMVFYFATGLSPFAPMQSYSSRPNWLSDLRQIRDVSVTLLSPALAMAAVAGVIRLAIRRDLALLAVVLVGAAPSVAVYAASLTTPKYFYYLVPFALLPALVLGRELAAGIAGQPPARRRAWWVAVVMLALADGGAGVRVLRDESRVLPSDPTWLAVRPVRVGTREPALVIGAGDVIPNDDGFRVRTGQAFAPVRWHREKTRLFGELARLRTIIDQTDRCTLYWSSWLPRQLIYRELVELGFTPQGFTHPDPMIFDGEWTRGAQTAHVGFLGYIGSPWQPPGRAPASATPAATYFLGNFGGKWPITELEDTREWQVVSSSAEGIVTLHQRR